MQNRVVIILWFLGILAAAYFLASMAGSMPAQLENAGRGPSVRAPQAATKRDQQDSQKKSKTRSKKVARAEIQWSKSTRYLRTYDQQHSQPGFTLIPTSGSAEVLLINMQGETLHKWEVDAARARLLPNGHLLVVHGSTWGETSSKWKRMRDRVTEYDWDGNTVWEYQVPSMAHHDVQRLPNGNTLVLIQTNLPKAVQQQIAYEPRRKIALVGDSIIEITPDKKIAWRWNFHDAVDVNDCGVRPCVYKPKKRERVTFETDWSHTNTLTPLPPNKWYDQGDERFRPGNILILPRRFWTAMIVDRETGKVVWRWDGRGYKKGLGAPHEARMVPKGFPGAGNILVLDNGPGSHNGESYIVELDPLQKKVVWAYDQGPEFFNKTRGSLQRLKNGNTLISWDRTGIIFEVTPEKETVWSFHTPVELTRAHRYDYDYCEPCRSLSKP